MAVGALSQRILPPANMQIGRSKLTAGTVSVAFPGVTDNTLVFASGNDAAVTGILTIVVTAGTGFSITSSVGGDTGYVAWVVVLNNQAS